MPPYRPSKSALEKYETSFAGFETDHSQQESLVKARRLYDLWASAAKILVSSSTYVSDDRRERASTTYASKWAKDPESPELSFRLSTSDLPKNILIPEFGKYAYLSEINLDYKLSKSVETPPGITNVPPYEHEGRIVSLGFSSPKELKLSGDKSIWYPNTYQPRNFGGGEVSSDETLVMLEDTMEVIKTGLKIGNVE